MEKVMNNATHIFDQFATILGRGRGRGASWRMLISIYLMCLHFWEVYDLWDGAFSLARTINPMDEEAELTKSLYWRQCVAVWFFNTPSCWSMWNGRWWIFQGGWVIKWRIGLSACINGGCNSVGDFAQYRISLFVHATLIPTCLLKWMH